MKRVHNGLLLAISLPVVVFAENNQLQAALTLEASGKAKDARNLLETASPNDISCKTMLGVFLIKGIGGTPDVHRGLSIIEANASTGDIESQRTLAYLYEAGVGVESNIEKAIFWYRKASLCDSTSAKLSLALILMNANGSNAIENKKEAELILTSIAYDNTTGRENQSIIAQRTLGLAYRNGMLGEINLKNSLKYYSMAAATGEPLSLLALAQMHSLGEGCTKDDKIAFNYYKKASNSGSIEAAYQMGKFLQEGRGCDKNLALSKQTLLSAANKNHFQACFDLAITMHQLNENDNATKWMQKASESPDVILSIKAKKMLLEFKNHQTQSEATLIK